MVPSLPLLSCESPVSVKENPDREKRDFFEFERDIDAQKCYLYMPLLGNDSVPTDIFLD